MKSTWQKLNNLSGRSAAFSNFHFVSSSFTIMDYRRNYGLRAPRPIGYSIYMVPQLENYALFATPYVDLNKKLSKIVQGFKQDAADHSKADIASVDIKRKVKVQKQEKKCEVEDTEKSIEETCQVDSSFGIVLNVASVKSEDLSITFGEGNEIEVRVDQNDAKLSRMDITFSRNCSYKYQLPDYVDKNSLVALRTTDDYLIILPRDFLREELLNKSIMNVKKVTESSANNLVTVLETESADIKENVGKSKMSDSEEIKAQKESDSKESESKESESKEVEPKTSEPKEKVTCKTRKGSKLDEGEAMAENVDSSKSGTVFSSDNGLIPVQVSRWLRPGMDIFMLRKYVVDLESYVSTVRKFIENASFITENSKTPELTLRALATEETDKHLESSHITKTKKEKKLVKLPSKESGYFGYASGNTPEVSAGNTPDASAENTPDSYDDSSSSSSVKSGGPLKDTIEE